MLVNLVLRWQQHPLPPCSNSALVTPARHPFHINRTPWLACIIKQHTTRTHSECMGRTAPQQCNECKPHPCTSASDHSNTTNT